MMDDIIVFGKNQEEHDSRLCTVMTHVIVVTQERVRTYPAMHEFLCYNYYVTLPAMLLYLYPYVFNSIMGCNANV